MSNIFTELHFQTYYQYPIETLIISLSRLNRLYVNKQTYCCIGNGIKFSSAVHTIFQYEICYSLFNGSSRVAHCR